MKSVPERYSYSNFQRTRQSPQVRFGLNLSTSLQGIEGNPIIDTLIKDVLGFNAPKILMTRTWKERLDVMTSEMANTLTTIVGTFVIPPALRILMTKISGVGMAHLKQPILQGVKQAALSPAAKLSRLGVAFGFYGVFDAIFWLNPFLRNWLTLKREKTADFDKLIGLSEIHDGHKPKRTYEAELKFQRNQIMKIFGIGVLLTTAAMAGFGFAARSAQAKGLKALSPMLEKIYHWCDLRGKGVDQIPGGLVTCIFWAMPAYLGWIHAARNHNERWENVIKTINSLFCFFCVTPMFVNPLFLKTFNGILKKFKLPSELQRFSKVPSYETILEKYSGPLQKQLLRAKDWQFGIGILITVLTLGMSPQILNIFLTKRRHNREVAVAEKRNAQRHLSQISPMGEMQAPEISFAMQHGKENGLFKPPSSSTFVSPAYASSFVASMPTYPQMTHHPAVMAMPRLQVPHFMQQSPLPYYSQHSYAFPMPTPMISAWGGYTTQQPWRQQQYVPAPNPYQAWRQAG